MTAVLNAADIAVLTEIGHQHPAWCRNTGNREDSDGCVGSDPEFLVFHYRDGQPCIPAVANIDRRPIEIDVSISRVMRAGDSGCSTVALLSVPGVHANLDRAQLRLLIAELQHIDRLWELS